MMRLLLSLLCFLSVPGLALAQAVSGDPLQSVMWSTVRDLVLQTDRVKFDDVRIQVYAPKVVEDGMHVPVSFRVTGIDDIEEIVVIADHNPLPQVLSFQPVKAEPFLAFRIKVQEATPVRAAVRTTDGVWYVGGAWVDAPGGGCTTPSESQSSRLWEETLNVVKGKIWRRTEGGDRLRINLVHPMDTGLVSSIPTFFLEHLDVHSSDGEVLATLKTFEPVAENPTLTFAVPEGMVSEKGYHLVGRDSDGNALDAWVRARGGDFNLSLNVEAVQ